MVCIVPRDKFWPYVLAAYSHNQQQFLMLLSIVELLNWTHLNIGEWVAASKCKSLNQNQFFHRFSGHQHHAYENKTLTTSMCMDCMYISYAYVERAQHSLVNWLESLAGCCFCCIWWPDCMRENFSKNVCGHMDGKIFVNPRCTGQREPSYSWCMQPCTWMHGHLRMAWYLLGMLWIFPFSIT